MTETVRELADRVGSLDDDFRRLDRTSSDRLTRNEVVTESLTDDIRELVQILKGNGKPGLVADVQELRVWARVMIVGGYGLAGAIGSIVTVVSQWYLG